jgi:putative phosphoribosyl transferase
MKEFTTDTEHPINIPCGDLCLPGLLHVPKDAKGVVIFAHGSGSSRLSKRNQFVATILNQAKLATVLFDLLTPAEEEIDDRTREFRFDITLLANRLMMVSEWVHELPITHGLNMGLFGASTGGGAALVAAALQPEKIKAVVSRGGRPDLADEALPRVKAPVLLIVGGNDEMVIGMNQSAMEKLNTTKKLEIIPSATHLFEEPGTLAEAARLAKEWFLRYLI